MARNKTTPFIKTIRNGRFTITFGQVVVGKNAVPFAGAACLHEGEPDIDTVGREFSESRALAYAAKELKHRANKRMKKAHKLLAEDTKNREYRKLAKERDAKEYKEIREQNGNNKNQKNSGQDSASTSTDALIAEHQGVKLPKAATFRVNSKEQQTNSIDAAVFLLDDVLSTGSFTVEELAEAIGVSTRTIRRYKAKATKPSIQTAYKIIDYLNNW